ncbi:Phosphoheptose isomerase protein [Marine Group I thaumarchaeote SCGC AAA799-E16]|uniref:Probable phosphoheptose isomerase n=2 Tax=Marine Group I TaxID=905826 RepID=A0A087S264_9ARCH|nr:Phosphoheptose isomerase protein [Marine Group I thaumarchaeote SCGC AAA799-E16]KFM19818.1 Phosphoheptose isomerase protein [Marine Group I thaumarchaeote SCGC RSA3]
MRRKLKNKTVPTKMYKKMEKQIFNEISESIKIIEKTTSLIPEISIAVKMIVNAIKTGNKIIIFGNGGSAADAQHIAAELIGRFQKERKSYPALALTTDSSVITSLGNDYSFDVIFSRQCESLVVKNDVVVGISTSGNSINVIKGLETAKENGATTISLVGNKGGKMKDVSDVTIIIDSESTAKIQEAQRIIYHIICKFVEEKISET